MSQWTGSPSKSEKKKEGRVEHIYTEESYHYSNLTPMNKRLLRSYATRQKLKVCRLYLGLGVPSFTIHLFTYPLIILLT